MRVSSAPLHAAATGCVFLLLTAAAAQVPPIPTSEEERIVADATTVFNEMLSAPGAGIPKSMLAGAEGVAIIPRVVKGGFIVGARYGRGVVIARDSNGVWHAPLFLTITGGNIGWQAGVQATDVVLVYRSPRSVESLMAGKLKIGADVAAAAGPVGREASAATDTSLTAEVYSYSRSRGLFAGVALDGSVLKIDHASTAAYYRPAPGGGASVIPPAAQQLTAQVVQQAAPEIVAAAPQPTTPGAQPPPATFGQPLLARDEAATVRDQLAEFAPRLYRQLDPSWQAYLALPAEVFQEAGHPRPEQLAASIQRFDAVAADPRYAGLAARPEFQAVHGLLRHYGQLQGSTAGPLTLPPPPQ